MERTSRSKFALIAIGLLFRSLLAAQPATQPVPTFTPSPNYPFAMRQQGKEGSVLVDFVVDVHGDVQNALAVSSSDGEFESNAVQGVYRWRFKPATAKGHPINCREEVLMVFELNRRGADSPHRSPEAVAPGKMPSFYVNSDEGPRSRVPSSRAPSILQNQYPVYPYALRRAQVTGSAKVDVVIGPEGRPEHIEMVEGTRPEFALAFSAAVESMVFNPAWEKGRPIACKVPLKHQFDVAAQVPAAKRLLQLELTHPEDIHGLKELDEIPHPVSQIPPVFPIALRGKVDTGRARVEFLIDTDGHAQLPHIVDATEPAFGYAAVQAVASWIFDPPRRQGNEAVARVRIPILFNSPDSTSPHPAAQ